MTNKQADNLYIDKSDPNYIEHSYKPKEPKEPKQPDSNNSIKEDK